MNIRIVGLFVGRAKVIAPGGSNQWWDQPWESGIFKHPASDPVWLSYGGLQGDEQADRKHHGGPDKAVCVYPTAHYDYWRRQPGLAQIPLGGFGENVTRGETDFSSAPAVWPENKPQALRTAAVFDHPAISTRLILMGRSR